MQQQIIGLPQWPDGPLGSYQLAWEQAQLDVAVADVFGYRAMQLGLPALDGLRSNRMPHRWLALGEPASEALAPAERVLLVCDPAALPFAEASLDLLVLPHTLELSADPHQVLREVERVLVPEGRVVLTAFNPLSLWGWRQARSGAAARVGLGHTRWGQPLVPEAGRFIANWRLRDWLQLMGFEVSCERFGCYRPAFGSAAWVERTAWMDRVGARCWPIFGGVYLMVATKRVRGMRFLGPAWKPRRARAVVAQPVAQRGVGD